MALYEVKKTKINTKRYKGSGKCIPRSHQHHDGGVQTAAGRRHFLRPRDRREEGVQDGPLRRGRFRRLGQGVPEPQAPAGGLF